MKAKSFLFIMTICFCTDSALVTTNTNRIWARISWIIILLFFARFVTKPKYNNKEVLFLSLMTMSLMTSMLIHDIFNINYIQRIVVILLSYAIVRVYSYEHYMSLFVKFVEFLALFSIICFTLSPLIKIMPFPTFDSYKCLLFTNIHMDIARNYGPFWEPGAFQLYLNTALLYIIRNMQMYKPYDIMLIILCIFTTQSTAGIIIMGLIFLYYFLFCTKSLEQKTFTKVVITSVFLIAGLVLYLFPEISEGFFFKLTALSENMDEQNSANVSAYTRYYSIFTSIEAIKTSPIWGVGLKGISIMGQDMYDISSNTNSILSMAADFGIIAGLLYILLFLTSSFKRDRGVIQGFIFLLILVGMYCTENLIISLPFWIFLFQESSLFISKSEYKHASK